VVREALLWMMQQQLADDFTPGVKSAWNDLYQEISTTMQRVGWQQR
jgi:hemoglobin-like flavoprotein